MDRICAGIVTYQADCTRLRQNIEAVIGQVEEILIFDNGSKNTDELKGLIADISEEKIHAHYSSDNQGIAVALNQLVRQADAGGYDWILTLDQDTIIDEKLIQVYRQFTDLADVGIICSKYEDRNMPSSQTFGDGSEYNRVTVCITSASLTNVKKALEVGGFDERLFIDMVDNDFCYTLSEHGYQTIQVDYRGFLHELGHVTIKRIGKNHAFAAYNHPAWRKYYITRNYVYMIKKHHVNPKDVYYDAAWRVFRIVFLEHQKCAKLWAVLKGIHDGRRM